MPEFLACSLAQDRKKFLRAVGSFKVAGSVPALRVLNVWMNRSRLYLSLMSAISSLALRRAFSLKRPALSSMVRAGPDFWAAAGPAARRKPPASRAGSRSHRARSDMGIVSLCREAAAAETDAFPFIIHPRPIPGKGHEAKAAARPIKKGCSRSAGGT